MADLKDVKTQKQISTLVRRLRDGENVNELIIELHKKYIEGMSWRCGMKLQNLRDDIRCAALLGLIQAVVWIGNGRCEHTDYSAYIIKTCLRFIRDEISKSYGVYVPESSVVAGIVDGYATVLSYDNPVDMNTDFNDSNPRDHFAIVARDDHRNKIKEELDSVKLTRREREIIEMRLDGFNDFEIGKRFYVTKVRVGQIRVEIQLKFQHLLRGN